jgi:hypothetical protein
MCIQSLTTHLLQLHVADPLKHNWLLERYTEPQNQIPKNRHSRTYTGYMHAPS